MGVGENFSSFCSKLTINNRDVISDRYERITRRLNLDFWDTDSKFYHSLYVGSYGRDTAIRGVSDLDMIFELPSALFTRYDGYQYNGQSALLQAVRDSIRSTYPSTDVAGDGQVVAVCFADGMRFEVVPVFRKTEGDYYYPDSNDGGRWRTTNPRPEIAAIANMDTECNGNLKRLARMARAWKDFWSAPMGGLLIDTLAYKFLRTWQYRDKSFLYYDWMSRDFLLYLSEQDPEQNYWLAVGSGQYIWRKGSFEYKAKVCYKLACEAIEAESGGKLVAAANKWSTIYGQRYA